MCGSVSQEPEERVQATCGVPSRLGNDSSHWSVFISLMGLAGLNFRIVEHLSQRS